MPFVSGLYVLLPVENTCPAHLCKSLADSILFSFSNVKYIKKYEIHKNSHMADDCEV